MNEISIDDICDGGKRSFGLQHSAPPTKSEIYGVNELQKKKKISENGLFECFVQEIDVV